MWERVRSVIFWAAVAGLTVVYYPAQMTSALLSRLLNPTWHIGHWWARLWARSIVFFNPVWTVTLDTRRLPRGGHFVVVSNHESMGDIILDLHLPLHFKFISKDSNFRVPVLGWAMIWCGYIPLARGVKSSIARCMARSAWYLDRGVSVLFYPEGTRSTDGQVRPFKPGAFRLAIESGTAVLPIATIGTRNLLPKNSFVFKSEETPLRVVVGDPIPVTGLTLADVDALGERARQAIVDLLAEREPAREALRKAS